ncbi:alpha/beta hydrolase [Celeribacter marinus]|uniref:alpha/beta hydrolase n=1 Tax=Celeribacter marinus TaxID=1397108 RepID=UPI003174396E
MKAAPYYADVADGPQSGHAYWLTTSDGLRIRAGVWPLDTETAHDTGPDTPKGTVFILPGRTECIEKYGRGARDLAALGYASLAIDWRGQGIADRQLSNRNIGHVVSFSDYQYDLKAVIDMADTLKLPQPYFLIGHSMGGAIGLRAVINGAHPFKAAVFSAPMWGIGLNVIQRILVKLAAPLLSALGLSGMIALGTRQKPYMLWKPFKGNKLTSDRDMYNYMAHQVVAHPDLSLGGPSVRWVQESMRENKQVAALSAPDLPALCFLGSDEKIVHTDEVRTRVANWASCELVEIAGGRHEIPMETPAIRAEFYGKSAALFDTQLS